MRVCLFDLFVDSLNQPRLFMIAFAVVFFPPSLLTLGIGWVYTEVYGLSVGVAVATFVSCLGSALGASVAFCRSRYMMRDMVKRFARRYNVIRAVDTSKCIASVYRFGLS